MQDKVSEKFFAELFEKISFGIIVVDLDQEKAIYRNSYADVLLAKHDEDLLTTIIANLKEQIWSSELRDVIMRAEEKIFIGYSIYKIDERVFAIFLKDISSKEIYLESQKRSHFYNNFSNVIAEIAHEIGNPLTTINTTIQVTLGNLEKWPPEKSRDFLNRVSSEIKRLSEFLKKMRSFSLQERLEIKPCRLEEIVARIALNFEIEFRQRKVNFQTRIAPETEALVDENAVTQVFTNLIKNSLEAMEGVSKGTIWISAEEIDPFYLKVVYLNDGPLIPPEILEKIFTPLFSTKESGRGIGLPLCQKLLTSMGGTIKAVAPRSGYGAEFHLFLPQKRYHL